ncbi:class I tRNA ligase family protein [Solirubrobacter soli]|uniref:class I tRNA ligase family protein n=1 Tax=Solirubrobacter soli TaxID=363832 RepID=UPI000483C8C7|nr:class I tRNA ligase family protein [Solirubrobacter soli]
MQTIDITEASGYDPAVVERKWQEAWRAANAFQTPPESVEGVRDVHVLNSHPFTSGAAHMGHVRSYSIGDSQARFRRTRGDAVLYSLGFDAFGLPAELGAIEHGLPPREWVDTCAARMREQFDALGFSFDWSRTFMSCDEDIYRWSQWLFLVLLEGGFIYEREGSIDWCDSCNTVLARAQVDDGECWRCHGPVRLVRRSQWYVRGSAYAEENDRRLEELVHWNKGAIGAQRSVLGRVDGVELDAKTLDGRALTLFTPHADVTAAEFALVSPNHPEIELWTEAPGVREQLAELRDAGWQREDRKLEEVAVVGTSLSVFAPGISRPLPVLISPSVDARFGPTAVLGIPSVDRTDKAIFSQLEGTADRGALKHGGVWRGSKETVSTRPAMRFRGGDFPISRQRAWGTPIPIVHCEACGTVPVPLDQLPVRLPDDLVVSAEGNALLERPDFLECSCPSCDGLARRETDTLDCHFDAGSQQYPLPAPTADRGESLLTHPELQRWVPVELYINGADTGQFVVDQRTISKMLRDLGHFTWLPDGECYRTTFTHEMVQLDGRKMSKHLGNTVTPQAIVEQVGADVLRLATLHAAAPAKAFTWDDSLLTYSRSFLRRLWTFAAPRLQAASGATPELDLSDGLRRKLASWCDTAAAKVTENYERLDPHRATRNVMTLFERIEDFEARVTARRELTAEDRDAVVYALLLLVRLLAPVTPHMAEELWALAGNEGFVADAGWPV